MKGEVKYRLGWVSIAVLLLTAGIADLVTLIPMAGDFVAPVYWVCVSMFLYTRGFGIMNARRFVTSIVSMAGEMLPGFQALPLLFSGAIALVIFTRLEDKAKSLNKPAIISPHKPLYEDGVRRPTGGANNDLP